MLVSGTAQGAPETDAPGARGQALSAAFDKVVRDSMADGVVPGMGAALIVDGKPVFVKGLGVKDLRTGEPVTEDTRFGIGSVTKTLTSAALMTLVEDGKLKLDDPASRYLPELKTVRDPRARLLLVRHLLSGRGCVPNIHHTSAAGAADLERTTVRLMRSRYFELGCIPGHGYVYPNFGMVMAGLVIQRVSGMPFEQYVEQRIFKPIGMLDSSLRYWEPAALGGNQGYYRAVSGPARPGLGVAGRSVGPTGMGSSTIADMTRYVQTLLNGGAAPNGRRVLSAASVAQLLAAEGEARSELDEAIPGLQTDYALGWERNDLEGLKFIGKGGSTGVMSAYVAMLPAQRSAVIFVANMTDYGKLQVVFNGLRLLAGAPASAYATIPVPDRPIPEQAPLGAAERAQLLGKYETLQHDLTGFTVFEKDGRLFATHVSGDQELVPVKGGLYVRSPLADFNGKLWTIRKRHGRIELWNGNEPVGQRKLATP